MKLLLTGFEPFGGSPVNPSEQVTRALAREKIPGIELVAAILPVDRTRVSDALLDAFETARPDAVVMLGEASHRAVMSLERVAINLLDFRIADNAGAQIVDEPIVHDAPAAYFSTLPLRAMRDAIIAAGVPVELSSSAGTFLCNQAMFTMLHHLAQTKSRTMAGFIHLPPLPEQVVGTSPPRASMALETMLVGLRAAIEQLT
ncbi:MAG: pyroglutamyl-peptidase I [Chloroflexi bacterium]|nr:pyroglutamyl-peptidase I [Chloroflexota bacterium]